MIKQSDDL